MFTLFVMHFICQRYKKIQLIKNFFVIQRKHLTINQLNINRI